MNTFFIADLHFDDINIKNYENRPFASVNAMNTALITNWNKTVNSDDIVYLLGDIGNISYIPMLNGSKYLVKGNHDTYDNNFYRANGFTEVYDLPIIYKDFWILSHEPLYINNNMPYANIFGHVHGNPNYLSASSHGFCVSVERINYTPISFEAIQKAVTECKQ